MPRFTFHFVLGLVCLCAMPLAAQDAVLGQMYGSGVHAYFGQDFVKAHESLTSAIDGKTQDPRAYYFRGLALLKLGRPQEAESDFQRGAKLESAIDPSRAYNIARALERIQGSDRAMLEKFRLAARMTVLKNSEDDQARRYQQTMKEQRAFLQQQSEGAFAKPVETPADMSKPPEVTAPATGGAPPADPFSTGEPGKTPESVAPPPSLETPAEKPVTKPGTPKPAAGGDDPFGAESSKAAAPASPAAAPATKPAPAAGGDDPFGAEASPKAAPPATPAATPAKKPDAKPAPAAGGDDPFGAEASPKAADPAAPAAAPAKKPDAKPAPAAGGDDPFGAEAPAAATPAAPATPPAKTPAPAKTPGDDPFGP